MIHIHPQSVKAKDKLFSSSCSFLKKKKTLLTCLFQCFLCVLWAELQESSIRLSKLEKQDTTAQNVLSQKITKGLKAELKLIN